MTVVEDLELLKALVLSMVICGAVGAFMGLAMASLVSRAERKAACDPERPRWSTKRGRKVYL